MLRLAWLIPLFLLLVPASVGAGPKSCPSGVLSEAQAATGASTDVLLPAGTDSVVFQYVRDGGTATVETQICCTDSCGSTGDWAQVTSSSKAIDGTTTTSAVSVVSPTCVYRTNITACVACDIDIFYRCGPGAR